MKNLPLLLGTLLGTLLLVVGISVLFSQAQAPRTVDQSILMHNARFTKGPENATVTIVEFSDLQCPSCKAMEPYIKQILEAYPQQVRLIYRHYPLTGHPYAQHAAETAEAAATFGKFWEMHDLLFTAQEEWSAFKDQVAFDTWIDEQLPKLSIDKKAFREKIQDVSLKQYVSTDVADGNRLNLSATPTFFVNGQETAAPDLIKHVDQLMK